jgi:hypothetical protein
MTITPEFKTTNVRFAEDNPYPFTPMASFGGSTYLVWVDGALHPMVAKITGGTATTARLDPGDDYTVMDDGHHKFSLGMDKNGYIHITGDMHGHPRFINPSLPDRYRNSIIMYWVSDAPEDITAFTFVGNDSVRAIPGYGYTYGSFNTDMNAELYHLSRVSVQIPYGYQIGELGVGMYRYSAASCSWTALGGLPPSADPAELPCILWEDNGLDGGGYQGFMASMRFDHENRLHFAATINADNSGGPTHAVYACSDDGGETFLRADGTPIGPLPMRVEEGTSRADIVEGPLHYVQTFAGAFFDRHCTPAVNYNRYIDGEWLTGNYRYWSDSLAAWSEMMTTPAGTASRAKNYLDGNGIINFFGHESPGAIYRTTGFGVPGKRFQTWYNLHGADEPGLRETNVLRAIGVRTEMTKLTMSVLRIDFANAMAGPPQIIVKDDSLTLADGAWVDLGQTDLGVPITKTLTIGNSGDTRLTIGEITVEAGFTVEDAPLPWVIPGTTTDLAVRLDATAEGQHVAGLTIPNNDAGSNPFTLVLLGTVGAAGGARSGWTGAPPLEVSSNPIDFATKIVFALPEASQVSLDIFDLQGRKIRCLQSRIFPAGRHTVDWDCTRPDIRPLAPGVYVLRLATASGAPTCKIVVLR